MIGGTAFGQAQRPIHVLDDARDGDERGHNHRQAGDENADFVAHDKHGQAIGDPCVRGDARLAVAETDAVGEQRGQKSEGDDQGQQHAQRRQQAKLADDGKVGNGQRRKSHHGGDGSQRNGSAHLLVDQSGGIAGGLALPALFKIAF